MEDAESWVQLVIGPFGTLIVLVVVCYGGFKFFSRLISRQEDKFDKQAERFDELHVSTINAINASTRSVEESTKSSEANTRSLEALSANIKQCHHIG